MSGFATITATDPDTSTNSTTQRRKRIYIWGRQTTEYWATNTRDDNYERLKREREKRYEELAEREEQFQPKFLLNQQIKEKTKLNDFDVVKDIISRNVCRRMMNNRR